MEPATDENGETIPMETENPGEEVIPMRAAWGCLTVCPAAR